MRMHAVRATVLAADLKPLRLEVHQRGIPASGSRGRRRAACFPRGIIARWLLAICGVPSPWLHANVYQWEWIDATDHALGRQQSERIAPDGAGQNAAPFADFRGLDLTRAWLHRLDLASADLSSSVLRTADLSETTLSNANLDNARLDGASFSSTNLAHASLRLATLHEVDFAGADIRGVNFYWASGLNVDQIYTTASYIEGDLSSIDFGRNDLSGGRFANKNFADSGFFRTSFEDADLSGANLANAYLHRTRLRGADLTDADIRGAVFPFTTVAGFTENQLYATRSYRQGDLSGTDLSLNNLTGWNFADLNLSHARFVGALLAAADFTNSNIEGASFYTARLTFEQLTSTSSFRERNLSGVDLSYTDMNGWNLSRQNLANARFENATLTGVDFSGSDIRGAWLFATTDRGFTAPQLYSTASYRSGDISGIGLEHNDLSGWNFAGQQLEDASFSNANLSGADFTAAFIRGASFQDTTESGFTAAQLMSTASYQERNLTGADFSRNDLAGWDLSGQILVGAGFESANLTGTRLTDAVVAGASFRSTTDSGFTAETLASTASFQDRHLPGVDLGANYMIGWDFRGFDLKHADFSHAKLASASFSNANLVGAVFDDAALRATREETTDFTAADTRGATGFNGAIDIAPTRSMIFPDGSVFGMIVEAGETVRVWDYDEPNPIAIRIFDAMQIAGDGRLQLVFDDHEWGSTLTFAEQVDVALAGTLDLILDTSGRTSPGDFVGSTWQVFDWRNAVVAGRFTAITSDPGLTWDLSNLYATGQVTLTSVPEPGIALWLLTATALVTSRRLAGAPSNIPFR